MVIAIHVDSQAASIFYLLATLNAGERSCIWTVDISNVNLEIRLVDKHLYTIRAFDVRSMLSPYSTWNQHQ